MSPGMSVADQPPEHSLVPDGKSTVEVDVHVPDLMPGEYGFYLGTFQKHFKTAVYRSYVSVKLKSRDLTENLSCVVTVQYGLRNNTIILEPAENALDIGSGRKLYNFRCNAKVLQSQGNIDQTICTEQIGPPVLNNASSSFLTIKDFSFLRIIGEHCESVP